MGPQATVRNMIFILTVMDFYAEQSHYVIHNFKISLSLLHAKLNVGQRWKQEDPLGGSNNPCGK